MKKIAVYQVNAFTRTPFGGNPAGVVPEADGLTEEEMQFIAREMNCSETAFVFTSNDSQADFEVRFFTPTDEVDLCGHATIATFHTLVEKEFIKRDNKERIVVQKTKAGILPVHLVFNTYSELNRIEMTQTLPEIKETWNDPHMIAELLGLQVDDFELDSLPLQIVSTGIPDMMVPIKNLETLKKASPDYTRLAKYQNEKGFVSIHAFTSETEDPSASFHTRDFAPSVGINEESATGTANGALGCYLIKNNAIPLSNKNITLRIEQGFIMNRPSEIVVNIHQDEGQIGEVKVGGSAVIVLGGHIYL